MIGGAKGIGLGIDLGLVNQYNRTGSQSYIEPEVLDSLVGVWSAYGMTNDSPNRSTIKNKLSNKGGDFVISNAAFKLNSGFGKYSADFESFDWAVNISQKQHNKATISLNGRLCNHTAIEIDEMKVNIIGNVTELIYWYIANPDDTTRSEIRLTSGINTLPKSYAKDDGQTYNIGFAYISGDSEITIEQIPSFEGAFVTDGVNDTIISTKTLAEMGITDEVTVVSMIHQIALNSTYGNGFTNYIENLDKSTYVRNNIYKAGKTGIYGYSVSLINRTGSNINNILGDKNDYGFEVANRQNTLNSTKFSVIGRASSITEVSSVAWYWTIIANKVLTTDQINQVIAYFNLDRTLKPDILCNVKKQGITNENHAEFGDRLIDFSGNGRDIQLNNIAWDGDSGIGKYNYPNWKVNVTQGNKYARIVYYDSINGTYSANFKGITDLYKSYGLSIEIRANRANTVDFHSIKEDGIYTITPPDDTTSIDIRFSGENVYNASCDITITQIPSHAGALCLDGVNDFGKVTGMPVYKDYTFIADRYINNNVGSVASKSTDSNQYGAFIFEIGRSNYSFNVNSTVATNFNKDRTISYLSKYSYNGENVNVGNEKDSDLLWIGTIRDNETRFSSISIYSLMSFPYSMSEFLIERQLKKHKLGTLYPDMVEFRPVIKANANYNIFYTALLPLTGIVWEKINIGDYIPVGRRVAIQLSFDNEASELVSAISSQLGNISITKNSNNKGYTIFGDILKNKSPQKINITIDEYIRYEDIVQPYPVLLRFNDENGNEVSWGGKFRVGSTITRIGSAADSNLLPNIYNIFGLLLNDNQVTSSKVIVEKTMVFKAKSAYIFDNNEPNCILSPRLLRIPNSSYKILGHIPDISGNGNHGILHNSAYIEGSGVNEDGSYQFDGVDDHVTIPTLSSGGKQVLMKVNWDKTIAYAILYDQRGYPNEFAIYNADVDNNNNPVFAYQARNNGQTYIDGILNKNIKASELRAITHNITITNELSTGTNTFSPVIGSNRVHDAYFTNMALYDFMLFDNISTDDKIKELNEYVGIEAKVELPPYYWDTYGKTNLDEDKATIQQRGVAEGDYDITNYNHAYDKMSGYGGYNLGRFDKSWASSSSSNTSIKVVQRNPYDITLKKLGGNSDWEFNNAELKVISNPVSVKFKSNKNIRVTCDYHYYPVGGNSEGTPLGITSKDLIANKDAIITISPISQENIDKYNIDVNRGYYLIYFQLSSTLAVNEEVTIEMLPLYPNGLVYDGVTDYSENTNIPALTDYTYILKRQILKGIANSAVMYKGNITVNQGGAFICNYCEPSDTNLFTDFSFGGLLRSNDIDKPIIYGTKTSVNGDSITPGENIDTVGINVGKWVNYLPMVLYKLILYPKTIPLLQINFLKNLMERDEIIDLNNKIFIQE